LGHPVGLRDQLHHLFIVAVLVSSRSLPCVLYLVSCQLHSIHSWGSYGSAGIYQQTHTGAREPFFSRGEGVKNQVLSCNMMRWFSPHPLKSCSIRGKTLPLLWHLSDISAISNFWPKLKILGDQLTPPPPEPAFPSPSLFFKCVASTAVNRQLVRPTEFSADLQASPTSFLEFFWVWKLL